MNAADYCRSKAAPPGSNFYYSSLFQSIESQANLYALFAFHYEIQDAILMTSDPGVTRIKLQWWRDEIQRLSNQTVNHPISELLQDTLEKTGNDISPLLHHINAMELLVTSPSGTTVQEWLQNQLTGLGHFWQYTGNVTGCRDTDALAVNAQSGSMVTILEVLQYLRPLLDKGCNPLPDALTANYGSGNIEIMTGTNNDKLISLLAEIVQTLVSGLDAAFARFPKNNRKELLYSLIMNRLAVTCCREIETDGFRLLEHRINLTPIRKLWIAWKTRLLA